ncbi:MAG: hypothetical protein ACTTJM_00785 [Bergeyella cardium]
MNLNIALSTIFYIMIFIFPGIIFRKFYFRGNFTRQFSQGNLFERFILTLFFSTTSILLTVGTILFFRYILGIRFLNSISYETITTTFNNIKKDEIPPEIKDNALAFFTIISLIYLISMIMGAVLHSIVVGLKIDIRYPLLKFNHPWHYIINGKIIKELSPKRYLYTNVDVLINDGYKKVMFSGVLLDILQNPQDNKIEHILVKNCYKYKFIDEKEYSKYERKYIPGNIMCFSKENIINFNLTHITRDKNYENTKFYLSLLLKILFFIALLYVSISPWMQNMIFNINGILKKIIFSIISIIFLSLFLGKINDELTTEKKNNQTEITWWGVFIYFLFLLGPFLWTIGYLIWWGILIYWIIIFIILAIISNFLKKE